MTYHWPTAAQLIRALKASNEVERIEIAMRCITSISVDGETIVKDEDGNWEFHAHLLEGILSHLFNGGAEGNGGAA